MQHCNVGWVFSCRISAIANDSIQTIGTFIASNSERPWWMLWLYMGGIFLVTVSISWYLFDGDVSYQRLSKKDFDATPTEFNFLQVAAPLFLLILTRLRIPVFNYFSIIELLCNLSIEYYRSIREEFEWLLSCLHIRFYSLVASY